MKVMLDENLPPALAKALNALFAGKHEIIHLRERFGPAVPDVDWIRALGAEGKWVIISGDRRITKSRVEYAAFRSSGLLGFFLSPGLLKAGTTKQMERICALWDKIEIQQSILTGGGVFEIPMTSVNLRQL